MSLLKLLSLALLLPLPKEASYGDAVYPTDLPIQQVQVERIPEAGARQEEAYRLEIRAEGIRIEATSTLGFLQAEKTLAQLGRDGQLPACRITDWPSFRIRGWMQDVGRTYLSLTELKREIDIFSRFKVNVFHLHLTENEAWRLESRLHPELTDPASMSRQSGQYYSLDEIADLDRYCRDRGVTLIPELDMPGHSAAFERATGHSMESPEGRRILRDVLGELAAVISGPYIHLGTDEVRIQDPAFVPEMIDHVHALGKQVISWNPGYRGEGSDMHQLWSYAGKPVAGIPAIDCRLHYINHFDVFADIIALHSSTVYGAQEDSETIAGSIIALWNDRWVDDETSLIRQNNLYASVLAMADRCWRGGGWQYFDDFGVVLPSEGPARADFLDFERRFCALIPTDIPNPYRRQGGMRWKIAGPFDNGGDLDAEFPYLSGPIREITGAGTYFRHTWGAMVPGLFPNAKPNSTVYAFSDLYAPEATEAGLFFETQNYSRSERDSAPPQGAWDYRHSRIWINGEEILPPEWKADDGSGVFGNENATARPPIRVQLKKGPNRILIKLPVGAFQTQEVRLVKWGFSCYVMPL